jgi:hypothetical protein
MKIIEKIKDLETYGEVVIKNLSQLYMYKSEGGGRCTAKVKAIG